MLPLDWYDGYIYSITCLSTGYVYVGATLVTTAERWKAHIGALERCRHHNRSLQSDWLRFGRQSFECITIETVPDAWHEVDRLYERERYWTRHYQNAGGCYNPKRLLRY